MRVSVSLPGAHMKKRRENGDLKSQEKRYEGLTRQRASERGGDRAVARRWRVLYVLPRAMHQIEMCIRPRRTVRATSAPSSSIRRPLEIEHANNHARQFKLRKNEHTFVFKIVSLGTEQIEVLREHIKLLPNGLEAFCESSAGCLGRRALGRRPCRLQAPML